MKACAASCSHGRTLTTVKLFDAVMALAMVGLAWRALADRDLFRAIIAFIALGLIIALAWVRLRAPDARSPRPPSAAASPGH